MPDWMRLVLGTLTIVRVPPPRRVDRATARGSMLAAPLVGAFLAVVVGAFVWALAGPLGLDPTLVAVLAVSAGAALTRGLHLDGLADTADGLGSGRDAAGALEVMAKSDIGPFGVLTLVLVLLAQVAALSATLAEGAALGAALAASALIVSRTSLTLACRSRVPAARPGGLGATVAGTVPGGLAALVAVVAVAVAGALAAVGSLAASSSPGAAISPAAAVALAFSIAAVAGLAAGLGLTRRCVRRLGGITGDTLGAAVETTMTVTLVVGAACLAAVL